MSSVFEKLEKQARLLKPKEKAALALALIEQLDAGSDPNAEKLWIEEARRRYEAYRAGKLKAIPGEDVMARARKRLG